MIMVRTAGPGDLPVLRAVFRRASLANPGDAATLDAHPEFLMWTGAGLATGQIRAAVTTAAGDARIVGFSGVSPGPPGVLELDDLFVDPEWMRRGVGRLLVEDLVERAERATGQVRRVEVDANPQAVSFYRRVGFVDDGEVELAVGTALRMHRDLPQ